MIGHRHRPRTGPPARPLRRHLRLSLALGIALASPLPPAQADGGAAPEPDIASLLPAARSTAGELGARLKAQLQAALAAGGPMSALEMCQTIAPATGRDLSASYDGEVGRTALKLRNAANAPDAFERRVLQTFVAQAAQGVDVSSLEHSEVVTQNGHREFRYMKAIPMVEAPCASCHGVSIAPGLLREIQARYPADEAVGFAAGDIRGAFTLVKTLR